MKLATAEVTKVVKGKGEEDEGPAPLWSDIHGLTKSGIDGMLQIAVDLASQIKELEVQLADVKAEVLGEMKRALARRIRTEDGLTAAVVTPVPYLGTPKREKLIQLGVLGTVIDKACDTVTPSEHVKIAAPKHKEE